MNPGSQYTRPGADEPSTRGDAPRGAYIPAQTPAGPPKPRASGSYSVLGVLQPETRHITDHRMLRSLLGAWALHACSPAESELVGRHLVECRGCASEATRLRDAVQWLSPADPLDLDPLLRARILEDCLNRRLARVPVPRWATPYATETARLAALLDSLGNEEWMEAAVDLAWHSGTPQTTLCGVLSRLGSLDGLVAVALGLADPLGEGAPRDPDERIELAVKYCGDHPPEFLKSKWRTQTQAIVRAAASSRAGAATAPVDYGGRFSLPLRDALLERAFKCWVHAEDIAKAVDYPYAAPAADDLGMMIDLLARMLPMAVAALRREGLAASVLRLTEAGAPGRTLHIQVEGPGGDDWYVPLDSPAAVASQAKIVAHVALDGVEFCQLAAGRRDPGKLAVGMEGDKKAVRDVLHAIAFLSRL